MPAAIRPPWRRLDGLADREGQLVGPSGSTNASAPPGWIDYSLDTTSSGPHGHPSRKLTPVIYAFDDCELDLRRYELRRDGRGRRIEPQVFDVLVLLVRERDRVVTKEEILDTVWGDRFVSESALTSRIKALRQALGDDGTAQRPVRTVRGAATSSSARSTRSTDTRRSRPALAPGEPPPQEIRFCTTDDGVRLAYATMGAGPPL